MKKMPALKGTVHGGVYPQEPRSRSVVAREFLSDLAVLQRDMLDSSLVSSLLRQLVESNESLEAVALLNDVGAVLARSFKETPSGSSGFNELSLALNSLVAQYTWEKVKSDSKWIGLCIQNRQTLLSPINESYSLVIVSGMNNEWESLSKVALDESTSLAQKLGA